MVGAHSQYQEMVLVVLLCKECVAAIESAYRMTIASCVVVVELNPYLLSNVFFKR